MKRKMTVLLGVLLLAGCSTHHSVAYYKKHPKEAQATFDRCWKMTWEKKQKSTDCRHAADALNKFYF